MFLKTRRFLFLTVWLIFILSAPITVFRTSPPSQTFSDPLVLTNVFQRITGLLAFTLVFLQIVIGAHMGRWVQIIGARAYKLHITQGLVAFSFIFIHPLFENAIVYLASKSATQAFLVFIPILEGKRGVLLVFGRIAFILATISVVAAYFRTKPFFRQNWRAFHILNYLVFYLIFIHASVGTDVSTPPFVWIYWGAFTVVTGTILYRFVLPLVRRFSPTEKPKELSSKS